jgi:hypothetical protein
VRPCYRRASPCCRALPSKGGRAWDVRPMDLSWVGRNPHSGKSGFDGRDRTRNTSFEQDESSEPGGARARRCEGSISVCAILFTDSPSCCWRWRSGAYRMSWPRLGRAALMAGRARSSVEMAIANEPKSAIRFLFAVCFEPRIVFLTFRDWLPSIGGHGSTTSLALLGDSAQPSAALAVPVEDPTRAQPLIEEAIHLAVFHLFISNYIK